MARKKKDETGQLLLRLPVSFITRIDDAAQRFRRHSRNQVAAEIVETYFDFWERLEQQRETLLAQQYEALIPIRGEGGHATSSAQRSKK